jgi:hypothetical protein
MRRSRGLGDVYKRQVLIYPNLTRFVVFNNAVVTGSFLINAAKNTFTYNGTNGYNCGINYNIQGSFYKNASYPNYRFEVRLLVNNNPITSSVYFGYQQTTGNFSFDVTANNIVLNNGDVINLEITLPFAAYYSNNYQFTFGEIKVNNIGVQETEVSLGDTLKFNDLTTKNILQKDFISSIVKLFNLYIFEDANSLDKVLKIMPFVDFYADAETIDWSDKIDRSKPLKVKPMSQLNARYYEFSFKSDSDYYNDLYKKRYNEDYGSYKFDSGYEFSKESTKVELIFSGTPIVGKVGQDKVYSTILKRTGDVQGQNEETTDSNIRILQAKKVTGLSIWNILNGGTTLGSYTVYPYAGHLNDPDAPADDIQFGVPKELFFTLATGALNVNQFNIYWKSYMQEITDKDSKMLTCNARLKYKDIYNLDFSKLIWVDGSLFRLNKIIDFNATAEDECTVELLKIINRIY